jgi:photosynthetic reaction center M subunit
MSTTSSEAPQEHDRGSHAHGQREDVPAGDVIPLAVVEEFYKRPGGSLLHSVFGFDPFDFWVGRFYVGIFGAISIIGIILGTIFYLYQGIVIEGTYNILAMRIDPPLMSAGLRLVGANEPGHYWQLTMFAATIAFVGWLLRQIDISRKLRMGYQIPIAFGAVVSSWITLQWLRPIAMGAWGNGFPLGITHHLDWVSNIGYQYFNFFYNPFHAIGITLLFAATLFLQMHGSAIWSATKRPGVTVHNVDVFWRGIATGYSVGEIGIHRILFWVGAASVLFANLCIFLSGTFVYDWNGFWGFWDRMPIWDLGLTGFLLLGLGAVVVRRGRREPEEIDLEALERRGRDLETSFGVESSTKIGWVEKLLGNGQIGPFFLGLWGVIGLAAFAVPVFIVLIEYMYKVDWNIILFAREFWNLSLDPPVSEYGLGYAPWHEGGAYLVATGFLHISVLAWFMRIYTRARATGLGTQLAWGFATALSLYFVIYLIRPVLIGNWAQAPGHGFRAILDWTNYVSIQYGNFYYNPFHMLSIFFLLGSTLLAAMHGATIVAAAPYGADLELDEQQLETSGTHRSQLFWRWAMGFNANAESIHYWAWWFAALCGITGAIGLLLSGTLINDWYAWAEQVRIVAPWSGADWSQYVFPQ